MRSSVTRDSAGRPKLPVTSCVPERELVGYMAFNHATGAMRLDSGHSIWAGGTKTQIYASASAPEATLFHNVASALTWIDRTIKTGRREWAKKAREYGSSVSWRGSDWKWLHRRTWSVVPVFMALPAEHPTKENAK